MGKPLYKKEKVSYHEETKNSFQTIIEQQEECTEIGLHEEEEKKTSFIKPAPQL